MKNQIKYKKLFLAAFVLFCLVSVSQHGEELKDRPDSIDIVMGINLNSSVYEELPGKEAITNQIMARLPVAYSKDGLRKIFSNTCWNTLV